MNEIEKSGRGQAHDLQNRKLFAVITSLTFTVPWFCGCNRSSVPARRTMPRPHPRCARSPGAKDRLKVGKTWSLAWLRGPQSLLFLRHPHLRPPLPLLLLLLPHLPLLPRPHRSPFPLVMPLLFTPSSLRSCSPSHDRPPNQLVRPAAFRHHLLPPRLIFPLTASRSGTSGAEIISV